MIATLAAILLLQATDAARPISFVLRSQTPLAAVSVVGSFNSWDASANPMTLLKDKQTWSVQVRIKPGVYQYLFCLNGNQWILDDGAPASTDGNGNTDSILVVEPEYYDSLPGKVGDGAITAQAVLHHPNRLESYRLDSSHAYVRLRTRASDVASVKIVVPDGENVALFPMEVIDRDALYDYWQGSLAFPSKEATRYCFVLQDSNTVLYYGRRGVSASLPHSGWFEQDFGDYPLPTPVPWVEHAVFYQIYPDRFSNGNKANDGSGVQPWGTAPTRKNRMGGDLEGIADNLPYLKQLGVNALYLNPIFEAGSNSGYDTYDYYRVDSRLGTNEDLKALVRAAHAMGIRVMLDGVFDHTGTDFFAFKDLKKNGVKSAYKDWYFATGVKSGQITYGTFAGLSNMPQLNTNDPTLRNYLLDVGSRWMKDAGIDGWRLDDASEVSSDFWKGFRAAVKSTNPQAFLLGEEWGDAHSWLQGDEHDSVTNYLWRTLVLNFFAGETYTPSQFENSLKNLRDLYSPSLLCSLLNPLDTYDTERLRTVLGGNTPRQSQAIVFQFTYPGVPSIYYGDEIGLEGAKYPDNGRCMIWDKKEWKFGLLSLYKSLIALRLASPALCSGVYRPMLQGMPDSVFAFERGKSSEHVFVFIRRGKGSASCPLPENYGKLELGYHAKVLGKMLLLGDDGYAIFRSR